MATQADYAAGTAAAAKVIQAEIDADVPAMFKGMVPAGLVPTISAAVAKAVIDAVEANRAQQQADKVTGK